MQAEPKGHSMADLIKVLSNTKFWATLASLFGLLVPVIPASWHQEADEVLPVVFAIIHAIGNAFPPTPPAGG